MNDNNYITIMGSNSVICGFFSEYCTGFNQTVLKTQVMEIKEQRRVIATIMAVMQVVGSDPMTKLASPVSLPPYNSRKAKDNKCGFYGLK